MVRQHRGCSHLFSIGCLSGSGNPDSTLSATSLLSPPITGSQDNEGFSPGGCITNPMGILTVLFQTAPAGSCRSPSDAPECPRCHPWRMTAGPWTETSSLLLFFFLLLE